MAERGPWSAVLQDAAAHWAVGARSPSACCLPGPAWMQVETLVQGSWQGTPTTPVVACDRRFDAFEVARKMSLKVLSKDVSIPYAEVRENLKMG